MKKLISLLAFIALLLPSLSQARLVDYYAEQGQKLPSISERAKLYTEIAEDTYLGTASQNNNLEEYLRGGFLGAATKIKLTDPNSVTPVATTTPGAGYIPLSNASSTLNSWIDASTLTGIPPRLQKSFTAGENITAGNAVIVGDGISASRAAQATDSSGYSDLSTTKWYAQVFTPVSKMRTINAVTLRLYNGGGGAQTMTVSIRTASVNVPTGVDLVSTTISVTSDTTYTATFASPLNIDSGSLYAIVVRTDGAAATIMYNAGGGYAGGNMAVSTNSGSTWGDAATDLAFSVLGQLGLSGYIYQSNATNADIYANNFIGFASQTVATSSPCIVNVTGIDNNQSSLSVGKTYYLSNTNGAISTSAGSQSRKVGLAISATELLIKHDNP